MSLLIFFAIPLPSLAAPSYTVSPLIIDLKVEARDIITKQITITNTGSEPVTVFPSVNNISITDGGRIQTFLSPAMSDRSASLASWIEISRAGIDIKIGESKTVSIVFRINPDPVPGVYHAFVGFGNGRNRDEAEAQIVRGDAPGSVATVSLVKKTTKFLKLSRFVIDRFVTSSENQAAVYKINNPSQETLVPKGEIIVYDTHGVEVASIPVNPDNISINPGENHEFATVVPTESLFGKYKAFLDVEYGDTQHASIQDTTFFYVIPFNRFLPYIGILFCLIAVGAFFVHKKYYGIDTHDDGSDFVHVHVRETVSEPKHHDIDLKQT